MRNYNEEIKDRVDFIRRTLTEAGACGIVFGNSGGKDCALCGILCKMACGDTVGLIMPCGSKRNYGEDMADALAVARRYEIESRTVDLTAARGELISAIGDGAELTRAALANIAPRLRMTALYAVAASENRLVAGTGNRSERYMGYFTKWGDGAFDFNPIADLTVTEIYEFLRFLDAPDFLLTKSPSAGLYDGQTDEDEMGVTYGSVDGFLLTGEASKRDGEIIERYHRVSEHKRRAPHAFGGAKNDD